MPYVYVFSEGEILRNGVTEKVRVNALVIIGYLLLSLNYFVLAPVFWFFLFRNLRQIKKENAKQEAPGEI